MSVRQTVEGPAVRIKPSRTWSFGELRELWVYRELMFHLAARDLKVKYKQTVLGVAWIMLQPIGSATIFAILFGVLGRFPSQGVPYLLLVMTGLVGWNLFSSVVFRAGASIQSNSGLLTKVYFPRLLLPLSAALAALVDFLVALVVLAAVLAIYKFPVSPRVVFLPFFVLLTVMIATGGGIWMAAINVRYRDAGQALPFLMQVMIYASPAVYTIAVVPEQFRRIYILNPLAGILEGYRWSVLGMDVLTPTMLIISMLACVLLLLSGIFMFRRVERHMADVV